jgi:alpha-1,6-mannosyltransferase
VEHEERVVRLAAGDGGRGWLTRFWPLAGAGLVACMWAVTALSHRFTYGNDPLQRPIPLVVALLVTAGLLYLAAVWGLSRTEGSRALLAWAFAVGLVLRVLFLFSTPICETDFYRYLWDGGVTAHGLNPYAHSPQAVLDGKLQDLPHAATLEKLAASSGGAIDRVNHPELATIYPPIAQAAFALSHGLGPWDLTALRLVLLAFDVATLVLIMHLLNQAGLPLLYAVIYWWNPVLVKETVNSAHMDVIVLPFVVGALLFAARRQHVRAAGALALAVGAKVWPVVLLPLLLRPLLRKPKQLAVALAVFGVVAGALALPVAVTLRHQKDSGFVAYGKTWEMNDALFMVLHKATETAVSVLHLPLERSGTSLAARGLTGFILLLLTLAACCRCPEDTRSLCGRALFIVAALFLLSPTQFPWYFLWLIPLLAVRPRASLLLLTVLLPIYYLRFYYKARDNVDIFDDGIVWLEFVPVWILLLVEWFRSTRMHSKEETT